MRKFILLVVCLFSLNAHAAKAWISGFHQVGDIYTYGLENTLAVYLETSTCTNLKQYYFLDPSLVQNAPLLIEMIMSAKENDMSIKFFVDDGVDVNNCYIKGLRLKG